MKKLAYLALPLLMAFPSIAHSATTISNNASGGDIGSFGINATPTYGQVFTAPITGILDNFTLYLNGGVGALAGGVGTWNGTAAYGQGFGSPTNLYRSANLAALAGGAYTFAPGIAVTAGQRYVAYLTTFGVAGAAGNTTMPLGTDNDPNINYFVWNNSSDPTNNSSWNYFANFGDARFSASFSPLNPAVPEPSTWLMMILGFGMVGASMRRRKTNVKVNYSFA
jgi:PEP-CTERM motif